MIVKISRTALVAGLVAALTVTACGSKSNEGATPATTVVPGTAAHGGRQPSNGSGNTGAVTTTPQATAAPTTTSAPATMPAVQPHVSITLTQVEPFGATVTVHAQVHGEVQRLYDTGSGQAIGGTEQALSTSVTWGDGSPAGGSNAGPVTCHPDAPTVPIDMSTDLTHTYQAPGSYSVTYTVHACGLGSSSETTTVQATLKYVGP